MISIENLSKVYRDKNSKVNALKNINLTIHRGEIFGIIGLSGAGKSTLIRCLNRLEEPTSGKIIIENRDILSFSNKELRNMRKRIGMIFQSFNLLSSRNIYDNVAFPLEIIGFDKKKIDQRVKELLQLVGLEEKQNAYQSQLSGGQKQRVAIARALANNPEILLCDEATSALDPQTTKSILSLLKEIQEKLGLTIVLITHQMEVIRDLCDRVAIIEEGQIIEINTVEEVFAKPKTETAKRFLSNINHAFHKDVNLLEDPNSIRAHLSFLGNSYREPIISRTIRKFNIDINILSGDINELQSTSVGSLLVQISGDHKEIEDAILWMRTQNIEIEVISNG